MNRQALLREGVDQGQGIRPFLVNERVRNKSKRPSFIGLLAALRVVQRSHAVWAVSSSDLSQPVDTA
ncbi:hypothetical protein [Deinococcus humi]|uniref:Uncharacterized protein n=1 Tax=Deinococcus humi TaxID=662880 RepID=A0A7W8JYX6_9DEIO|nr:hypothetical protein [Deinococcus humi]MBB5365378.1 hypothetical protein [Deinococcus humi]